MILFFKKLGKVNYEFQIYTNFAVKKLLIFLTIYTKLLIFKHL